MNLLRRGLPDPGRGQGSSAMLHPVDAWLSRRLIAANDRKEIRSFPVAEVKNHQLRPCAFLAWGNQEPVRGRLIKPWTDPCQARLRGVGRGTGRSWILASQSEMPPDHRVRRCRRGALHWHSASGPQTVESVRRVPAVASLVAAATPLMGHSIVTSPTSLAARRILQVRCSLHSLQQCCRVVKCEWVPSPPFAKRERRPPVQLRINTTSNESDPSMKRV